MNRCHDLSRSHRYDLARLLPGESSAASKRMTDSRGMGRRGEVADLQVTGSHHPASLLSSRDHALQALGFQPTLEISLALSEGTMTREGRLRDL